MTDEEEKKQEIQEETSGQSEEIPKKKITKEEVDERELLIKRQEDLNAREDALNARELLGGQAEAGYKPKPKEETDEELAKRFETGQLDILKK